MDEVTLTPVLSALLRKSEPGTKLVDPNGTTLGIFLPSATVACLQRLADVNKDRYSQMLASLSRDELFAVAAVVGGIPHEEVVRRLGLG